MVVWITVYHGLFLIKLLTVILILKSTRETGRGGREAVENIMVASLNELVPNGNRRKSFQ
jgi:hypothetical protein